MLTLAGYALVIIGFCIMLASITVICLILRDIGVR